jgi:hypothetical protein
MDILSMGLAVVIQAYLAGTNAGPGKFEVHVGAGGIETLDKWTYAIPAPTEEWLADHWESAHRDYAEKVAADVVEIEAMGKMTDARRNALGVMVQRSDIAKYWEAAHAKAIADNQANAAAIDQVNEQTQSAIDAYKSSTRDQQIDIIRAYVQTLIEKNPDLLKDIVVKGDK